MDPMDGAPNEETGETAPDDESQEPVQQGVDAVEAINILPLLVKAKPDWIAKEAARVVKSAKEDDESRDDYKKRYAEILKLYASARRTFGYPAQGALAPHIAIMTKAILHLWARIFDQVIPAKGDIVKGFPLGPNDMPRAQRVEKHMNWQLRNRMADWTTSIMFTILSWLLAGSTFRYYRWDPINKIHVIDQLPFDDVIVSYTESDTSPLMKNVERITIVRRMPRWEMEKYAELGFFSNLNDIFPADGDESGSTSDGDTSPSMDYDDSPVRKASDDLQGVEPPRKKGKYAKREILEQHTFLKFPDGIGVNGLDGQTKPVIITVDKKTKKPVSVTIREEPDPIDQERFNQETAAHEQAMSAPPPMPPPGMPPEMAPPPPELPPTPAPVRMQTVYRVIHYGLFPNPDGFYRLGVGSLLESSNELANVLAGEFVLSAKFANMVTGIMARGTKESKGDLQLTHGKIIQSDMEPELMKDAVKFFEFHPPVQALMEMVEKLENNSEIAASADILSGEKGSSNETAKGTSIRDANAKALISVMTRIFLDPLKYELKLVAHGNSIYLDAVEYFPFTQLIPGPDGQQVTTQEQIGRQDYVEDVHLEFTADARMTSKPERISDARESLTLILQSPLQENVQLVDFAFRKLFTVSEGFDYLAKMGPPPQPPPPPTPQSQVTENAGFFNEKDHPVFPDDNHMAHLHEIDKLKNSPLYEHLSSTGKQLVDRHQRAHVAQFYLQAQALADQTGIPIHEVAKQIGLGRVAPGPSSGSAGGIPGGQAPGGQPPAPGGSPGLNGSSGPPS
jgi:hypothetical protein